MTMSDPIDSFSPTFGHQDSTMDCSRSMQASSWTQKDAGKPKNPLNEKKFSRRQAALMFFILSLVVFAGDFLFLGANKTAIPLLNAPWREGWKKIIAWACSETCMLDFLLVFGLLFMLACHMLYRTDTSDSNKSAAPERVPSNTNRKRQGLAGNQVTKQSNSNEGPTPTARPAGAVLAPTERARLNVLTSNLNSMLDTAARQGNPDKAGKMLLDFERQGQKPDAISYNLVIRAYAKKGILDGAQRWLARMERCGPGATLCSYNTVLDACAKTDNTEACETLFGHMLENKLEPNVISYATIIYAQARRGQEAEAEKWLRAMIAADIQPDAVTYNSMIHACGVAGNAEGAERWIQEMLSRGLEATVTTYTTVIDACAKCGDVPRAEKWLSEMINLKIQPNVVSFGAMIDACAKARDPARAEYWHNRMAECNVKANAHSYSAVINACAKASDVERAVLWLGKSEGAGVANDVIVYSSVIDACGKVGDAEGAMTIFRRMQANGIRPHIVAYSALARPFAYRGEWMKVEWIAQEMDQAGVSKNEFFIYAQLIGYACARPRESERAESCFREALKAGLKANDHVVGALARAVGRHRCTELMRELCNGREVPERVGGTTRVRKPHPSLEQ